MTKKTLRTRVLPIIALFSTPIILFFVIFLLDFYFWAPKGNNVGILSIFYKMSVDDARQVLGGMGEVIAAILGIVITVASIVVQLAATRYTPKITDMFFKDFINLVILAFFVFVAVYCLLVNYIIRGSSVPESHFIPIGGSILTVILMTFSILLIAPYFIYIFYFLEPGNIVKGLKKEAIQNLERIEPNNSILKNKNGIIQSVEQLSDISMNAIKQKDKGFATSSIDAMRNLLQDYMVMKQHINPRWFKVEGAIKSNSDFLSMNNDVLDDITNQKTWLEYKVLRQYQMMYNESLNTMRDIDYIIAIDTRYLGEDAIKLKDVEVLKLVIKFFNTYIRATLNAKDIRTAYNILHQYRLLAEQILINELDEEVISIGGYFKYYGQLAFSMNIPFITETVAYDLTTLLEKAFEVESKTSDELLGILLEIDKEAEGEAQEKSLRGVRKAQIKMATYFLLKGDQERVQRIYNDMKHEPLDRIRSIRSELLAVESKDFWEVIDRGENFDYLIPERKQHLTTFFKLFKNL
jgi:Predicted membrane protein (DUF2254)